jgi:HAAS
MADDEARDYLNRLRELSRGLDRTTRAELLQEIEQHIDDARRDGVTPVAAILAQLGPPEQIARAAGVPAGRSPTDKAYDRVTIALLALGGACQGIGWLVGVVMLWRGPRWTRRDRLIGTLLVPLGPAGAFSLVNWSLYIPFFRVLCVQYEPDGPMTCSGPMTNTWYVVASYVLLGLIVVVGAVTCTFLAARARRFDHRGRQGGPVPVAADG